MSTQLVLVALLGLCSHAAWGQLSNALAQDKDMEANPFRDSSPLAVEEVIFGERKTEHNHSSCALDLRVRWITEVGSGVYTTPTITDLFSDGNKEVVSSTFTRYVEALDAATGTSTPGWPFVFGSSSFHASPIMYDVDNDGRQDVVVTTNDAEIVFLRENGEPMHGWTLKVPPLSIRKNWYEGLDEDRTTRRLLSTRRVEHSSTELNAKTAQGDYVKQGPEARKQGAWGGGLTQAGVASLDLLRAPDYEVIKESTLERTDPLRSAMYQDRLKQLLKEAVADSSNEHVLVDAHIMSTPVVADLDLDGRPELIATVSYYFDREETSNPSLHTPIAEDVQPSKYVAGGVVVFQLDEQKVKWSQHLDLTTDTTKLRAYIYTTPTIADLDGDGKLDIIVGTSVGFVYVIDDEGRVFSGFPKQIGEIQGSVVVEDVTGDGHLDLIAADASGNVVCISKSGAVQWDAKISGFSSQAATVGDIDADNKLDVVVGTTSGHVWALSGATGVPLDGFPVKTEGKIISPVLLTQLRPPGKHHGNNGGVMQLVVPSFDGGLYIIDGKGSCVHRVDIGESAYSMVLSDDVTGDGKMDLLVGTMAGNIYLFGTTMPFKPALVWNAQGLGSSGYTSKLWQGVEVSPESRRHRDVLGSSFIVKFEIVDRTGFTGKYDVVVSIGGSLELLSKTYSKPGVYTEVVPSPQHRGAGTVFVRMKNSRGQLYEDSFSLSFNVHFYKTLKWVVFVPFATTAAIVLTIIRPKGS